MLNRSSIWLLVGALVLMPALLLTTSSGGSKAYYVILLACLIMAIARPTPRVASLSPYAALLLAFALPLLATVCSAAINGTWGAINLERSLRLALGAPILLLAMLHIDPPRLRQALWGVMLAGWVSTASVLALIYPDLSQRPLTTYYNAVSYGNLMLLMAVLTLFSLPLELTPHPKAERAFKLVTALVTFGGFMLTQTRSGWIAIPIFIGLALVLFGRPRHPVRLCSALVAILIGVVAIGALSPTLRDRVHQGYSQGNECLEQNAQADTSVCVRLQLWRSSLEMAAEHPFTGVGSGRAFQQGLHDLHAQGRISEYVATNYGEPHNDVLEALAVHGVIGAIALLILYLAPAVVFVRRMNHSLPLPIRAAAAMGAATCLGFAAFGLTELMFRGMRTLGFYVVLVMLFMALSDLRTAKHPRPATPPR